MYGTPWHARGITAARWGGGSDYRDGDSGGSSNVVTAGEAFGVVLDRDELSITPTTTVADVKEQIDAAANTVLIYEDAGRIRVLEHSDVIVDHVDERTELTVLPVTDHYPQLEQHLQRLREDGA